MRDKGKRKRVKGIWKGKESSGPSRVKPAEDKAGGSTGVRRPRSERGGKLGSGGEKPAVKSGRKAGKEGRGRQNRWSPRTTILAVVLLVSLAALLWVYTGTGVLKVRNTEVRGNHKLDADYLRALSGITPETHLLKMDVKAVERALLTEPYLRGVKVSRRFPDTVVLDVEEREPQGVIVQNGRYHLVDTGGRILESAGEMPQDMVEIRDLQVPVLYPGKEISGDDFTSVMSLLRSLPPELEGITEAVGYDGGEGLYLVGSGTRVIYGDASNLSRKNTVAFLALRDLVDNYGAVEYIDVSLPDHPVIKPT